MLAYLASPTFDVSCLVYMRFKQAFTSIRYIHFGSSLSWETINIMPFVKAVKL